MKKSLTHFRKKVLSVLAQSGNCAESNADIHACTTISEVVQVWKKYWAGLIDEVPTQVVATLDEIYSTYADEINAAGVYYNETSPQAMCIISSVPASFEAPFDVRSEFFPTRIYVLGKSKVIARGCTQVYANCSDAVIELHDSAHGTIVRGWCLAADRSTLVTADRYERRGKARVFDRTGL